MWNYLKPHLHLVLGAAFFMGGEVLMELMQPGLMSRIVDEGVLSGRGDLSLILKLGSIMIACVILSGFCGSMNNVLVQMIGQNTGNRMRKDCFRKILDFSFSQTEQFGTGSLITRVTNDITQVERYIEQFCRSIVRMLMLTLGSICFLFRLNRRFGLILLYTFPMMLLLIIWCLHEANPMFLRLQRELDQLNEILQEDISGLRIIKACVKEAHEKGRFGKQNDSLVRVQLRILILFAILSPMMNVLMYLAVTMLLLSGALQVSRGDASPGVIMAAISYTTQLLNGVLMLVMVSQNISRGAASWERVREILHSESKIRSGQERRQPMEQGKIEFRDVSFSYHAHGAPVLSHINLVIQPGETVGIMGATGAGKSTLVNLIPRFYDVTEGTILVDEMDVRDYPLEALRSKVTTGLQKSELFHVSVEENIRWGKPDAAREEILKAARIAQAHSFISELPQAYETEVAERGASLSGGQKQRIAIARAILRDTKILILDDATSALDLKTESDLYRSLRDEKPDCTKIIVAQRIASVRNADRIYVIEKGSIQAFGTHEELMKSCAAYQDIYASQLGEGEAVYGSETGAAR